MEGRKSPHLDMLFPRRIPGSKLKNSLPASRAYLDRRPLWLERLVIERQIWCVIRRNIEALAKAAQMLGGLLAAAEERIVARKKIYEHRYKAVLGLASEACRDVYDEDGYCESCGNKSWRDHSVDCAWADANVDHQATGKATTCETSTD